MKKYTPFISAIMLAIFVGATTVSAGGLNDALPPKEVTKEEAAKSYPPKNGKSYPVANAVDSSTGGFFQSPYSSRVYDCRKLKHGALVLDEGSKEVFVKP